MAVAFQAFATYAAGTTPWTPSFPTGGTWLQGDIVVIVFETDLDYSPSPSGGSETWTEFPWSPIVVGTATVLNAFWARASQDNPTAPTFTLTGANHCVGSACAFRGCPTSGDPWDVYSSGSNTAANATIPGATTTVAGCLVLVLCSSGNNGTSSTRFSAWTNGDLGSLTERFDQTDTVGNGGGFGAATGTKAVAGTYGDTTVTEAFTSGHAYATIAFKPATGGGSVTHVSAAATATGGSQLKSVGRVHVAALATITGGIHAASKLYPVAHLAGEATAAGGTHTARVDHRVAEVSGSATATGGTQTTSAAHRVAEVAGEATAQGGTHGTTHGYAITEVAGTLTIEGGDHTPVEEAPGGETVLHTAASAIAAGGVHAPRAGHQVAGIVGQATIEGGDHTASKTSGVTISHISTFLTEVGGTHGKSLVRAHTAGSLTITGGTHTASTSVPGQNVVSHTAAEATIQGGTHSTDHAGREWLGTVGEEWLGTQGSEWRGPLVSVDA